MNNNLEYSYINHYLFNITDHQYWTTDVKTAYEMAIRTHPNVCTFEQWLELPTHL